MAVADLPCGQRDGLLAFQLLDLGLIDGALVAPMMGFEAFEPNAKAIHTT